MNQNHEDNRSDIDSIKEFCALNGFPGVTDVQAYQFIDRGNGKVAKVHRALVKEAYGDGALIRIGKAVAFDDREILIDDLLAQAMGLSGGERYYMMPSATLAKFVPTKKLHKPQTEPGEQVYF